MLINWFHKKAYIEPDLKLYMNPISKCKGVRHDDPQGVIFGGKKYFLCVNYAEICVNGNAGEDKYCISIFEREMTLSLLIRYLFTVPLFISSTTSSSSSTLFV